MQDHPGDPSIESMPKIDLHRHLEGSLRLSTLQELSRKHEIDLPADPQKLSGLVTYIPGDIRTPGTLLGKFQALRRVYTSPAFIERFVRETVEDAAGDHVVHLEMRFSPLAISRERGFPVSDVLSWVNEAAVEASRRHGISVCLIVSVNRHEPLTTARHIAEAVVQIKGEQLVGFDLAGDEESYPADPFLPLFRELQQEGLRITVHAGEWSGADAVRQALLDFNVNRIGHGVRVVENPEAVRTAREMGVPFEVCPMSNIYSGVAGNLEEHPVHEMLREGLNVTINTDNPGIQCSTLSGEAGALVSGKGITLEMVQNMMLNAAQASFLPEVEKEELEKNLRSSYGMGQVNG